MFTEKTLITEPLDEAVSAPPKDELAGRPSNTCPINSACEASCKGVHIMCKSPEPDAAACGGGACILQSAEVSSPFLWLQPLFSHKVKTNRQTEWSAPVVAGWIPAGVCYLNQDLINLIMERQHGNNI